MTTILDLYAHALAVRAAFDAQANALDDAGIALAPDAAGRIALNSFRRMYGNATIRLRKVVTVAVDD